MMRIMGRGAVENTTLNIDAALLFDEAYNAPAFTDYLAALNRRLAPVDIQLRQTGLTEDAFVLFNTDDLHVLVSLNRQPLAAEGFASALASPLTQMNPAGFADRVAGHRQNIFITVGDGPIAKTPALLEMEQKLGMPDDRKAVALELKLTLLHRAVLAMLDAVTPQPTAIHWCQSDTLHTPAKVQATDGMILPVPLMTHPGLFSSGRAEDGRRYVGFVSNHSKWFCGKTIVVPETAETSRMMALVDFLIEGFLAGRLGLRDGDLVPFSQFETARIRHLPPSDGFPEGQIEVTMEEAALDLPSGPQSFASLRAPRQKSPEEDLPIVLKEPGADQPLVQDPIAPPPDNGDKGLKTPPPTAAAPAERFGKGTRYAPKTTTTISLWDKLFTPNKEASLFTYLALSFFVTTWSPVVGVGLVVLNWVKGPYPTLTLVFAFFALIRLST